VAIEPDSGDEINFCCFYVLLNDGSYTLLLNGSFFTFYICRFSTSIHRWDTNTSDFENKWMSHSGFDFGHTQISSVWFRISNIMISQLRHIIILLPVLIFTY